MVAAALIPPKKIIFNDMDLLETTNRHRELYGSSNDPKQIYEETKKITTE